MQSVSQNMSTLSLVKSREMLDKFASRIANIQSNRSNSKVIQSIQHSSKKIQHNLDNKIEQNYNLILNTPTLMPLTLKPELQKENTPTPNNPANSATAANGSRGSLTALEGAKTLMYHYWERNKKSSKQSKTQLISGCRSESKLPQISCSMEWKVGAMVRAKEREQELGTGLCGREEEAKEQYHIKIKIIGYQCQNEGKYFLKFQKIYYKRWEQIESILKALQKFAQHYLLDNITVLTQQIFNLIRTVRTGQRISPHDLLACCQNADRISEQHPNSAGIRFYGKGGCARAVVVVQSAVRRWLQGRRFKARLSEWRCAIKIQREYRYYKERVALKDKILSSQIEKIRIFNEIQKQFVGAYRRRELSERIRYQIHVPSHNYTEWQKISMEKFIQKQNTELCRIFKVALQNPTKDIRIIYISPINLSKEIIGYYMKLLQLASDQKLDHKLIILSPQNAYNLPLNISLTQQLYYSVKTMNKIKKIVGNHYAYIVPSSPSNDYIHLCVYLNIPLYSAQPQKLAYLSTKSGCKNFQEHMSPRPEEGVGVLPYSVDIYSESSLLNELTNLIYRYPYVKRWVLKIDNQQQSRGLAYIDVCKILGKKINRSAEEASKHQEKLLRQQIYSILENTLIINKEERVIPIDKATYPNQNQFLEHYYTRGGIIQASINNFETDLENICFCVDLEPDGEWSFVTSYYKITNKHKAVAAYFDSNLIKPPLHIESILRKMKMDHFFGYFTFQFLSINHQHDNSIKKTENKVYYLNSIDPHLNEFSSAHYLRRFISKDSNALYIPIIQHPALKELRMQTFFHLCRLQNISFDIQKKVGNIFTFIDGLESSCIGIMTFNQQSKEDCYAHTAEVLQFLNSKLKMNNKLKEIPANFFGIKNAVKGHLNKYKKNKFKSQKSLVANN